MIAGQTFGNLDAAPNDCQRPRKRAETRLQVVGDAPAMAVAPEDRSLQNARIGHSRSRSAAVETQTSPCGRTKENVIGSNTLLGTRGAERHPSCGISVPFGQTCHNCNTSCVPVVVPYGGVARELAGLNRHNGD